MTDPERPVIAGEPVSAELLLELEALRWRVGALDKLVMQNAELQVELARLRMQGGAGEGAGLPAGAYDNPRVVATAGLAAAAPRRTAAPKAAASVLVVIPPRMGAVRTPVWEGARLVSLLPSNARVLVAVPAGIKSRLKLSHVSNPGRIQVIEAPETTGGDGAETAAWTDWLSGVISTLKPSFMTHLGPLGQWGDLQGRLAENGVGMIARLHHDDFSGGRVHPDALPLLELAKAVIVTTPRQKELLGPIASPDLLQVLAPPVSMPLVEPRFPSADAPARLLYIHDVSDPAPLAEFIALSRQLGDRTDLQPVLVANDVDGAPPNMLLRRFPERQEAARLYGEVELCYLPGARTDLPQWLVDCMALGRMAVGPESGPAEGQAGPMLNSLAALMADRGNWSARGRDAVDFARNTFRREDWKTALADIVR